MLAVAIYIKDTYTSEYNRVDLFDDEKISVVSSIQNINDISKTFTDFSQTFTVPATKQNNKIFRHWYDNSNDSPFSTLVKSDAYIEIDTITFRKGKIQLKSANVIDGQAQDYSITFIGILGNLKDIFAGKFLSDLNTTLYDFAYTSANVLQKVTSLTPTSPATPEIAFPLITSKNLWTYGLGGANYNIEQNNHPIYYSDLFPALRLTAILNMISTDLGVTFSGNFLTDPRFTNAFLLLKNAETFVFTTNLLVNYSTETNGVDGRNQLVSMNYTSEELTQGYREAEYNISNRFYWSFEIKFTVAGLPYTVLIFKDGVLYSSINKTTTTTVSQYSIFPSTSADEVYSGVYTFKIQSTVVLTFNTVKLMTFHEFQDYNEGGAGNYIFNTNYFQSGSQTLGSTLSVNQYLPNIKIEDFFTGLIKMFNLTCYSSDGINYTVEQLENYYSYGSDVDITKYVLQDKKDLNRVKTYKKINFEYEKSDSFVNVAFKSANNIEYGTLYYSSNPPSDGEEYGIKLPFEDLNFENLSELLQVGYLLKTDFKPYIPKPIILYDYNPATITTVPTYHFSTTTGSATGIAYTVYRAFGQEYIDTTVSPNVTYGLNFPIQQSTLTNEQVGNGLYNQYYEKYFANIFNFKARLVKVSAILPTSILTTLKLNDNVIIRDTKYLINTMTTDLTTGEVQFELLTDQRQ